MSTPRALVCKRGHSRDPNDPASNVRLRADGRYDCATCKQITDRARYVPRARRSRSVDVYEEWIALQPISRAAFAIRMGMSRDAVDKAISRAQQRLLDLRDKVRRSQSGSGL